MKTTIVLFALVATCFAAEIRRGRVSYDSPVPVPAVEVQRPVAEVQRPVAILRQSGDVNYDGNFNYEFEAENGISSFATGSVKQLSPEVSASLIQGGYTYTAPDGTPIVASYYADETGFHIVGDHIPTPPPIPAAIAKSLEILPPLQEEEQVPRARKVVYRRRV